MFVWLLTLTISKAARVQEMENCNEATKKFYEVMSRVSDKYEAGEAITVEASSQTIEVTEDSFYEVAVTEGSSITFDSKAYSMIVISGGGGTVNVRGKCIVSPDATNTNTINVEVDAESAIAPVVQLDAPGNTVNINVAGKPKNSKLVGIISTGKDIESTINFDHEKLEDPVVIEKGDLQTKAELIGFSDANFGCSIDEDARQAYAYKLKGDKKGLSTGAIVGIAVGAVAVVGIIVGVSIWMCKRKSSVEIQGE